MADPSPAQAKRAILEAGAVSKEEVEAKEAAAEKRRKQLEQAKIEKAQGMSDVDAAKVRREELEGKKLEEQKQELLKKQAEAEERVKNLQHQREAHHMRKKSQEESVKAKGFQAKLEDATLRTDVPTGTQIPRDVDELPLAVHMGDGEADGKT